jgi:hypothetical protein
LIKIGLALESIEAFPLAGSKTWHLAHGLSYISIMAFKNALHNLTSSVNPTFQWVHHQLAFLAAATKRPTLSNFDCAFLDSSLKFQEY